jgi:DNA-nicking Smr family endonuclease
MDKKFLKSLKKELLEKQKADKIAERSARIQATHNTREEDIFREAMSGVSPMTHDKAYHEAEKPKIKSRQANLEVNSFEEEMLVHDTLSDELEIEDVDNEEVLSFCKSGIQKSVFKKLRTGSYRISDELDLHGSTLKQAKKILLYYLQEAVQFEGCCVRIIHGKGHRSGNNKPVLKTHVNHWLSEHERVLAFHSAKAKDGGTGAVYVLLKTQP